MLSDEQVEKIVERLLQRVEQANTYFLKQLGSKVKQIKKLTPSEAHKLVQMLKYGGEYNDIIKKISKYTDVDIKEIDKIFKEFSKKDQSFAKGFYQYRNKPYIPYEQNVALKRQTEALARIVKNKMYDYTRSKVLGYTITDLDGKVRFKGLKEIYNQVLDTAVLNVSQGTETFDSAMTRILAEIGGSGLKTIEYESGRSVRLDSVIRMHTQSMLRELHNENQALFGEEFDSDGVEISVHANPAPDHAPVQGRQFSTVKPSKNKLSEWEKLQAGEDAVAYNGITYNLDHDAKNGYRPISELNCYHYTFAIVLGVSEPEYSDEQLQQIIDDNNNGFELDGKHYTMYEGTQLQRGLERKIREQKDIQILAKESDNKELIAKSQSNITTLTNKYKELSQASGLPTKTDRLRVGGYKRTKVELLKNQAEIDFARENNAIWHSTENLEEIIKTDKIITPSISTGKEISKKVQYGTQFIEFKPEILENVNKATKLYKGDGGNNFTKKVGQFDNLMQMLKDSPKTYNELKFNKDLSSLKYIKRVYLREDEPKEIIKLLKENDIEYVLYKDNKVRAFRKKK